MPQFHILARILGLLAAVPLVLIGVVIAPCIVWAHA